ncbi:MAG: hypothetical protein AAFW73_25935 [Bacteroidota bacterium]
MRTILKRFLLLTLILSTFISCSEEEACTTHLGQQSLMGVWQTSYSETWYVGDSVLFARPLLSGQITLHANGTASMTEGSQSFDAYHAYYESSAKFGLVKENKPDEIGIAPLEKRSSQLYNVQSSSEDEIRLEYYRILSGSPGTSDEQGILYQYTFRK